MSKKVTYDKYSIPPGAHFFLIPRESYALFSEVEINVTAENVWGNTTSETLKLIPMETGKKSNELYSIYQEFRTNVDLVDLTRLCSIQNSI